MKTNEKLFEVVGDSICVNVNANHIKVYFIEEERDDIQVTYDDEIAKDISVDYKFNNDVNILSISYEGKKQLMSSVASLLHLERKIMVLLPRNMKTYSISNTNADIRINNVSSDNMNVSTHLGSVKVKYCDIEEMLKVVAENATISIKDIEIDGLIEIVNDAGFSKIKDVLIDGRISIAGNNGSIYMKTVKVKDKIDVLTYSGNVDFDDVYAQVVNISAKKSMINYFNGNLNKDIQVSINNENGDTRTNVVREKRV